MGRPPIGPEAKTHKIHPRVSQDVRDFIAEHGSGVIEDLVRRTKAFRDWLAARKKDAT